MQNLMVDIQACSIGLFKKPYSFKTIYITSEKLQCVCELNDEKYLIYLRSIIHFYKFKNMCSHYN